MILGISSVDALPFALRDWKPDTVVSITKPGVRVEPFTGVHHLTLAFHDAEGASPKAKLCRIEHVRCFLALIDQHAPDRLLIHCTAGLSRSPAFGIIAMVHRRADPETACRAMADTIGHASPNRYVLRLGDHALDTGFAILSAARRTFTFNRTLYGPIGARCGFKVVRSIEERAS